MLVLSLLLTLNNAFACDFSKLIPTGYFMFNAETYLPVKIDDVKDRPYGFLMKTNDFERLLRIASPVEGSIFFENIRMRVKTIKGVYYINKDGVILFHERIFGKLNKKILNSIDLGFGLYELKTCDPLEIRITNLIYKRDNKKIKAYLEQVGELADWRNKNFIGYLQ